MRYSLSAKWSALPLETSSSFPKETCTLYLMDSLALRGKVLLNPTILSVYWCIEHPLLRWNISDWTEIKAQPSYEKWETYFIKNRHCQTPPLTPDIWKNGCIWQHHPKEQYRHQTQQIEQECQESVDLDCKLAPTCAKKILNFIFQHCALSYSFRTLSSTLTFFSCILSVLQSSQPSL